MDFVGVVAGCKRNHAPSKRCTLCAPQWFQGQEWLAAASGLSFLQKSVLAVYLLKPAFVPQHTENSDLLH